MSSCGGNGVLIYWRWECKIVQSLWKTVWQLLRGLNIQPPYHPTTLLPSICTQEKWKHKSVQRLVHNILSSFICRSQKLEITQMAMNGWMDEQLVIQPYNGIPSRNRNDDVLITHNYVPISKELHLVKEARPKREYILYDPIHIKF